MRKDIEIVSFDLQGTLSDSSFSDEFWRIVLPKAYALHKQISLKQAIRELRQQFEHYGKYDYRYYAFNYWKQQLRLPSLKDVVKKMKSKPCLNGAYLSLLEALEKEKKLIIISSTTRAFIKLELGMYQQHFHQVYSSLDDFRIPGKPPGLYLKIANELRVKPERILHVGDSWEMDVENARAAGLQTVFIDKQVSIEKNLFKIERALGMQPRSHLSNTKST